MHASYLESTVIYFLKKLSYIMYILLIGLMGNANVFWK